MTTSRERLLTAADDLIYTVGIASTGVDAVAHAAGVTKPTLYAHFARKTDLVAAVLQRRHEDRSAELEARLAGLPESARPLGVFDWLQEWYDGHGERGCGFLNAAAQLSDPHDPGRVAVRDEKTWLLALLTRTCREAGLTDPARLGSQLLLLVDGVAGRVLVHGPSVAASAVDDARAAASVLTNDARS